MQTNFAPDYSPIPTLPMRKGREDLRPLRILHRDLSDLRVAWRRTG